MIIEIPDDNSIVKWKYKDNEGWKSAEISDLIKAYERPQGQWNYIQAGMAVCPFCGAMPHKEYKNFCAKCGADMRGEK